MNERERFIDIITHFGRKFGLNTGLTQIYALLYWEEKPLSLDEISEALKMSKGNVSLNIRKLEDWGAVKRIWKRGSSRHYYQANLNFKEFLPSRIKEVLEKRLRIFKGHLDEFKTQLEKGEKKEKIEEIEKAIERAENMIQWMEEGVKSLF
ncbi:hypothetical protein J7K56_01260 [Candidatus Calescamantes bacterium]|nr:hypothetical protein [Candidatus Calescamantes bacterium]